MPYAPQLRSEGDKKKSVQECLNVSALDSSSSPSLRPGLDH